MKSSFILFSVVCVLISCATRHTAIVSLGQNTSLREYIIPVHPEQELLFFQGVGGENTILVVNKDSAGIYISNYWYFPNVNKLDTFYDRPASNLHSDSLFFSGVDRNGNWRHIETSKMCMGYFGIHKDEVTLYDSLLTLVRSKKRIVSNRR